MISIKNTENLTGVTISGDFDDLYNLVDAFYEITLNEDSIKYREYIDVSTRLLGVCYDIRHAFQGDREIAFVDNHLSKETMEWHGIVAPEKNVYYQCNCLYPEMIFGMIVINELIDVRMKILTKKNYLYGNDYKDKSIIWDKTIITLRGFQCAFAECMKETFSPNLYSRWLNTINAPFISTASITGQYIDTINIEYINMTKEKRLKSITKITKRIANFWSDDKYHEVKRIISQAAKEYKCSEYDIRLTSVDYPDEIEW